MFTPALTAGGAERVLINLLKVLDDRPRHLVVMERRILYPYDAELHVLAGDFAAGGTPPSRRILRALQNLAQLSILKRRLPAVWIGFTTWANILNVLAGGGRPTVLTSHNHESINIRGRLEPILGRLIRLTYPRADAVVAVSNAVKRDLVERFGVPAERVVTIYNTVDLVEATRLAEEPLEPDFEALLASGPTIVTAGNLKGQKGQWHLLRIFAAVKRRGLRARLVILGDGPLRDYLTGLSGALGLSTHARWDQRPATAMADADVIFTGFHRNPFRFFRRATLFAFPSLWEGFGNVLVEAMAMGCPVMSTDCLSGPREILAPESTDEGPTEVPVFASAGVLMPRLDGERRPASVPLTSSESVWADAIARLLEDDATRARYRISGPLRARAFTLDAIGPEWRSLLHRVASRRGDAPVR